MADRTLQAQCQLEMVASLSLSWRRASPQQQLPCQILKHTETSAKYSRKESHSLTRYYDTWALSVHVSMLTDSCHSDRGLTFRWNLWDWTMAPGSVGGVDFSPLDHVRDLDMTLQSLLTMKQHTNTESHGHYYQMRQLHSVRWSLTVDTLHTLVHHLLPPGWTTATRSCTDQVPPHVILAPPSNTQCCCTPYHWHSTQWAHQINTSWQVALATCRSTHCT